MTKASTPGPSGPGAPPRHRTTDRGQADLALEQDRGPRRSRRQHDRHRDGRRARATCRAGPRRCGSAWPGRSPPAGSIAPARATRPCRTAAASRVTSSRVPSARTANVPGREQEMACRTGRRRSAPAQRLDHEQRDEQIEAGAGPQLGQLARATAQAPASRPGRAWSFPARPAGPGRRPRPATPPGRERPPRIPARPGRAARLASPRPTSAAHGRGEMTAGDRHRAQARSAPSQRGWRGIPRSGGIGAVL